MDIKLTEDEQQELLEHLSATSEALKYLIMVVRYCSACYFGGFSMGVSDNIFIWII